MDYLGTDPEGFHYFRCPAQGSWLKDKVGWSRYCDMTLAEYSEKPAGQDATDYGHSADGSPQSGSGCTGCGP